MNRPVTIAGALATAALTLTAAAGCKSGTATSGGATPTAVSAAVASASASWNAPANRQVRHTTRKALDAAQTCAATAQLDGKPLGITATLPEPFSGQTPSVSGVPFKADRHPILALEAIGGCMPYTKAQVKACAEQATPSSFHLHGIIGEALTKFAVCLGKVPATAEPSPAAS